MSWLAKSIISSLTDNEENSNQHKSPKNEEEEEDATTVRGVKEDITELTETLSRQFRGFASFLAPSPPSDLSDPSLDDAGPNMAGIRSDLAEIGGKFRSGIEKISNAKEAVSEISKMASSLLMVGNEDSDDDDFGEKLDGVAGIDDEIVEFVRSVSMRPEIWLDFPMNYDEEEDHNDDFYMTDAQQEHALAVERLVPALSSLRIELCPSHMSEGLFWKIYFLLLYAKLNKKDADLLITPQIERARATLLQDMPNKSGRATTSADVVVESNPSKENFILQPDTNHTANDDASAAAEESIISAADDANENTANDDAFTSIPITDAVETEKHAVQTNYDEPFTSIPIAENTAETERQADEAEVVDKSVIQERRYNVATISVRSNEEENDEWLQEEDGMEVEEAGGDGRRRDIQVVDDEDISFSDLEEDDDDDDDGHKAAPENH